MSKNDDPGAEPDVYEKDDQQRRQTLALERIAEAMDDLRTQFKTMSDALSRIANRVGRHDE